LEYQQGCGFRQRLFLAVQFTLQRLDLLAILLALLPLGFGLSRTIGIRLQTDFVSFFALMEPAFSA